MSAMSVSKNAQQYYFVYKLVVYFNSQSKLYRNVKNQLIIYLGENEYDQGQNANSEKISVFMDLFR
jgi:hypothetical protein